MPRDRFSSSSTPKFVSFIPESTPRTVSQSDNHPVAISSPPEKPMETVPEVPLEVDPQNVPLVSETEDSEGDVDVTDSGDGVTRQESVSADTMSVLDS